MPQTPRTPAECSAAPELPKFADRIPDLVQGLRHVARALETARPNQSYIPYFEDVYALSHSLKGVLRILSAPPVLADFILGFTELLNQALSGESVCRRNAEAGRIFQKLADRFDQPELESLTAEETQVFLDDLKFLYVQDVPHEERMREIPAHLFYVNEMVSKKAREIRLLNLNHCVIEDELLLEQIPLWRTQLQEALSSEEFGRGLVVNFLPFLSTDLNNRLKVWAWVAAATHSRAALKQRIKEVMPKVSLGKL